MPDTGTTNELDPHRLRALRRDRRPGPPDGPAGLLRAGPARAAARRLAADRQRPRRRRTDEDFVEHVRERADEFGPQPGRGPVGRLRASGCASPAAASPPTTRASCSTPSARPRARLGDDAQLVHYLAAAADGVRRATPRRWARTGWAGRPGRLREAVRHLPGGLPRARRPVHSVFDEEQVFRIDHFLGKEAHPGPARAAVRQRALRAHVEPRARRAQVQIDVPETSTSPTGPSSTTPPARRWTCWSPTCSRSPPRWRWSRRSASRPTTCRPRASR